MREIAVPGHEDAGDEVQRAFGGSLGVYLLLGVWLGIVFVKSEIVSWFRIQEMFRFDAFHMYGVIGSAVVVGAISVALMKRGAVQTREGHAIEWPGPDETGPRPNHILGGLVFGVGWGIVGACPGPIYALIGSGATVMVAGLVAAAAGAWVYGLLKPRLPH